MNHPDPVSLETRSTIIKLAAAGAAVRIAMRGDSMLPDVREGMVLELRSQRAARVGDIVVFRAGARLVAHRVVALRNDALLCAGDAQPDSLEHVPNGRIVGVVEHVYDAEGRRVDTPAWRSRGVLRARLRAARAVAHRALPHLRKRAYLSLFNTMSAVLRGDEGDLAAAIRQDVPWRLAAMARRHRCSAALCAALERLPNDEYAGALRAHLRKDRWSALVRRARLAEQLQNILQTLRAAGIDPLLLKGAERLARGAVEAELYECGDIDVLVPVQDVERACDALRQIGYRQQPNPLLDYDRHHHAAPLFAENALPVEVHRALTVRAVQLPNSWRDLERHMSVVSSPVGAVRVLDRPATALHLTVHCLQRPALRELVLLGRQLQQLDAYELASLRGMLARERRYAVPLNGALVLAARLIGMAWECDERSERFARWMLLREDLPRPMRARPECMDGWIAGVPAPRDGGALRAAVRLLTGIAIAAYAPFMRR